MCPKQASGRVGAWQCAREERRVTVSRARDGEQGGGTSGLMRVPQDPEVS